MIVEKIFGPELFNRGVQRVVVEQNRAKDAAFGFGVLGQWSFECGGGCGHSNSPYFRPRRPARQEELIGRGILPGNRPDLREGFVLAVVAVVFLEYLAEAFGEFPAGLFRAGRFRHSRWYPIPNRAPQLS